MSKTSSQNTAGYTLMEMLIVIAIVGILGGAALVMGASGLQSLRFQNTYNRSVFLLQSARSLASTGKNTTGASATSAYVVEFVSAVGGKDTVELYALNQLGAKSSIETLSVPVTTNLVFGLNADVGVCKSVKVQFLAGAFQATISCTDMVGAVKPAGTLTVTLTDTTKNRSSQFYFHPIAGIPQI